MSQVNENGVPHHEDCCEITQQSVGFVPDTGKGLKEIDLNCGNTKVCVTESSSSSPEEYNPVVNLNKRRNNFKQRSTSDSGEDVSGSLSSLPKGILKQESKSRLRSLSESAAEIYQLSQNASSVPVLDEWPDDEENEGDEMDIDRVKKTVRFSNTVHRQLFRSNSSILGQRKKNQRKQRNKKKKEDQPSSSAESDNASDVADRIADALDQVMLSDSGIEVDSDPSEGQQMPSSAAKKRSKKHKRGKKTRCVSESSAADLMFELDL